MAEIDIKHLHEDLLGMKKELQLIRNILAEERTLSPWAKKELEEARKVPDEELVDLEIVRKRLLDK